MIINNEWKPTTALLDPTLLHLFDSYTCPAIHSGFPDDVICSVAIYADDTTLYSKCDQASDN